MTRRGFLVALWVAIRSAFGRAKETHFKRPDTIETQAQWLDFIGKWNELAKPLNAGVYDERLWRIAEKSLLKLLV